MQVINYFIYFIIIIINLQIVEKQAKICLYKLYYVNNKYTLVNNNYSQNPIYRCYWFWKKLLVDRNTGIVLKFYMPILI
jgi:hypothetical protein